MFPYGSRRKQLLSLRSRYPRERPIGRASAVEFGLGLSDIGNRQREMRRRWVFVRAFCKRRWLLAADETNLARFANIHPKARNAWKCRSARIRGQAEHPLVKIEVSGKPGLIAVNA